MRSSVVVVSYRPGQWLEVALSAAVQEADQVVLVDNGSANGRASEIGRRVGVEVVATGENLGFPAGVNKGISSADGDVLALLNDDAIPDKGWLDISVEVLRDASVAAVAPKLLLAQRFAELRFPDETWQQAPDPRSLGRMLHEVTIDGRDVLPLLMGGVHRLEEGQLDGVHRRWRWTRGADAVYVPLEHDDEAARILVNGEPTTPQRLSSLVNNAGSYLSAEGHNGDHGWVAPDDGQFDTARECFGACGAAMAFTRETWQRVGVLPASFFAYYEDADWCWRARLGGQRIFYEPAAVVRHIRGATSGGEAARSIRMLSDRNRIHVLARNAPLRVMRRQLARTREPDFPDELYRTASRRALRGLAERADLRRKWRLKPEEVWQRWAGVDERWEDPGSSTQPMHLPPRLAFGD